MKNRKIGKFTAAGFVILIVLVVAILLSNGLRRSSRIMLPDAIRPAGDSSAPGGEGGGGVALITVTPETVQYAIESLSRPDSYRRSITEERFWDGGSGTTAVLVSVSGGWTRTDSAPKGRQVRHSLTDGTTTYVWYGSQAIVYECPAGDVTADQEQGIPTYEDVLELPENQIEKADYRTLSGLDCIYVETGEDENGFVLRYWVGVDTGLLTAAERLKNGEVIYRMGSLSLDAAGPVTQDFTLPDGTVVTES